MSARDSKTPLLVSIHTAKGNIPQDARDALAEWYAGATERQGFAKAIAKRLETTEMSVHDKSEEPGKKEARMVFEIDVKEGQSTRLQQSA